MKKPHLDIVDNFNRTAQARRLLRDKVATPPSRTRISNTTATDPYDSAELRPFDRRHGALDAFALPSRMGNRLHYPDGRIVEITS